MSLSILCPDPRAVAIQAIRLAYAASSPMGAGHLHFQPGELPANEAEAHIDARGHARCDYVRGRMMKLAFQITPTGIEYRTDETSMDYELWCHRYPTYTALFEAAKVASEVTAAPA